MYFFLTLGAVIMLFPFFWMFSSAFKTTQEINKFPPQWLPGHLSLDNFRRAFAMAPFAKYFFNSVFVMVCSVGLTTFTTILAAFAFSRLRFPGRKLIFSLLLSGLQNIDPQYYTAARVDGSGSLRIFLRITVPLLAPTIFLVCIVNTISCFKVFSELYPLFNGKPGPFYNLYTVVYYIRYAMMENRKYGVAAAAAIVLFGFIFVFTMIQRVVQSWMSARKR